VTHSVTWKIICATRLIHMCDVTRSYVWRDAFICVTWLVHMCDMTHSYVWHDAFICVTWLIHMCDMTHSYVWRDSFICVTWLIHMCDMTTRHVWLRLMCYARVIWHTSISYVHVYTTPQWVFTTHINEYLTHTSMSRYDTHQRVFTTHTNESCTCMCHASMSHLYVI